MQAEKMQAEKMQYESRPLVLLTRLFEECASSAQALRRRGWSVCCAPVLRLRIFEDRREQLERALEGVSGLAVTSKSGLRAFARLSSARALSVYAVGRESAAFARRLGFAETHSAEGNVQRLAECIAENAPKHERLLHIVGTTMRGNLVANLERYGYCADRCVLYEALSSNTLSSVAYRLLSEEKVYASLIYSARSAEIFSRLYRRAFGRKRAEKVRLRLCALSHGVGSVLSRGFPSSVIETAARLDERALFESLDRHRLQS